MFKLINAISPSILGVFGVPEIPPLKSNFPEYSKSSIGKDKGKVAKSKFFPSISKENALITSNLFFLFVKSTSNHPFAVKSDAVT
ncbi:hypothetical protein [Crocosphaera chwakensis]|uniref:Uncharacterized protein n=1 Tax=Crocosphaera chwakensis CCY0110 TaxID=391612 RepID=A3IS90_9CHRO|nr:hypothetical protein [Crocosphaera chwakensis]EAZ90606.1 hypothetical protein CY0110_08026 [Crocosphaera chwakensis CCY0110]